MKNFAWGILVVLFIAMFIVLVIEDVKNGGERLSSDIDKIVAAKNHVRKYVAKYPDTLDFYNYSYSPKVNGNTVTLKFSCKNAFGVPETHIINIEVE